MKNAYKVSGYLWIFISVLFTLRLILGLILDTLNIVEFIGLSLEGTLYFFFSLFLIVLFGLLFIPIGFIILKTNELLKHKPVKNNKVIEYINDKKRLTKNDIKTIESETSWWVCRNCHTENSPSSSKCSNCYIERE